MRRPLRISTLFFAVGLLGCTQPSSTHLLIVVVDALRADHLHCYGYTRPTSPRLDTLAADGTRFRNAVTSSPWTLPALATLMTSLYPSVHGAIRPSDVMRVVLSGGRVPPADALDESRTTLAEVLHSAGFRTAAFVSGAYPGRVFGFAQGFERFDQAPSVRTNVTSFLDWLDRERPARFRSARPTTSDARWRRNARAMRRSTSIPATTARSTARSPTSRPFARRRCCRRRATSSILPRSTIAASPTPTAGSDGWSTSSRAGSSSIGRSWS